MRFFVEGKATIVRNSQQIWEGIIKQGKELCANFYQESFLREMVGY